MWSKYLVFCSLVFTLLIFLLNLRYIDKSNGMKKPINNKVDESYLQKLIVLNKTLTILRHELKDVATPYNAPVAKSGHAPPRSTLGSVTKKSQSSIAKSFVTVSTEAMDSSIEKQTDQRTQKLPVLNTLSGKTILIFTMDSISDYEKSSLSGGAAGEIIIRRSLEDALRYLGAKVTVLRSDREFNRRDLRPYDAIILDPWTWAAKGWVPKPNLVGQDEKIYILDFFGSTKLRGKGMKVPPKRFLTAFGAPGNTFLGYYMQNKSMNADVKKNQGIIWGKDPRHFQDRISSLRIIASEATLLSTATNKVFDHPNVQWLGHQSPKRWMELLQESKFLLGLGNPILGPSAIDAISSGCMFLNPVFDKPALGKFNSQHPFAEKMGLPYVCNFRISNHSSLIRCVRHALGSSLPPMLPRDFTFDEYVHRVKNIFAK